MKYVWTSLEGTTYTADSVDEFAEALYMGGYNVGSLHGNAKSRAIEIEVRDRMVNELLKNASLTYEDIGLAFGMTRERVRQIMAPDIAEMRKSQKVAKVEYLSLKRRWDWVQQHEVKECYICERRYLSLKKTPNGSSQRFCSSECRQLWQTFFRYYGFWVEHQIANAKTTVKRVKEDPSLLDNSYTWRARYQMAQRSLKEFEETGTVKRKRKIRVNVPTRAAVLAARQGIMDIRAHLEHLAQKYGWELEPKLEEVTEVDV